jgi:hypothetical protein
MKRGSRFWNSGIDNIERDDSPQRHKKSERETIHHRDTEDTEKSREKERERERETIHDRDAEGAENFL